MPVRVRLWARAKRTSRWFGYLFLTLLVLGGIGVIGLQLILATPSGQATLRRLLVTVLSNALQTEVELGALRLRGLAEVEAEHFILYDRACQPFIRARSLRLQWVPYAFWEGFWNGRQYFPVSYVDLEAPSVFIYKERHSGLTNVDRLFPKDTSASTEGPKRWWLSLRRLSLKNGTFRWVDSTAYPFTHEVGYLNYADLWLDSLFLESSLELSTGGKVWAAIHKLTGKEAYASLPIHHISLVLKAFPNKTLIPYLHVRLPHSELHGRGTFTHEGLDKLFRNTETKFFQAHLWGTLGWADVAAFAGTALPLQSQWTIDLQATGDLYRIKATRLRIELDACEYLVAEGEIIHYARPEKMRWQVRLHDAFVSWEGIYRTLPLIGLPKGIHTHLPLRLQAEHAGWLHQQQYTFTAYAPELQATGKLQKTDDWSYLLKVSFRNWEAQRWGLTLPLSELWGEAHLEAKGFDLAQLRGLLQAELHGRLPQGGRVQIAGHLNLEAGNAQGTWQAETPYGTFFYSGRLPLHEGSFYQGSGWFDGLSAELWGASGTCTGTFIVSGAGLPWTKGWANLILPNLSWLRENHTYFLNQVEVYLQNGCYYRLRGPGLSLAMQSEGDWLEGLQNWGRRWEIWQAEGLFPLALGSPTWRLSGELVLDNPVWLWLLGLPAQVELRGALGCLEIDEAHAECAISWDTLKWQDLYLAHGRLTLRKYADSLYIHAEAQEGSTYLKWHSLVLQSQSTSQSGLLNLYSIVGAMQDTFFLALSWQRAGASPLVQIQLDTLRSHFYLGHQLWTFRQGSMIEFDISQGLPIASLLEAQSRESSLGFRQGPEGLTLKVHQLPISPVLTSLGKEVPLEGRLSLGWEGQEEASFWVDMEALHYAGFAYPPIRLTGKLAEKALQFQGVVQELNNTYLQFRGRYNWQDTAAPMYVELRKFYLPARWLSPFLREHILNLRGSFQSRYLAISGKPTKPHVRGEILCDNLSFYLPFTRMVYAVEGFLLLRNDSIIFRSLELRESQFHRAHVDGSIILQEGFEPHLNLEIKITDPRFLLAVISPSSDAYLYGRAELEEGSLRIKGLWHTPQLEGYVRFGEGTELHMPLHTYQRSSSAHHVRFVGPTQPESLRQVIAPTGLDLHLHITSVPRTQFRIIFDERTGDEIAAQGSADLFLRIDREGKINLAGSYEIQRGEYRINLQGVASKRLVLEPGGTISWDGDLYSGRLHLTALYRASTNLQQIDTAFFQTVPVELRVLVRGTLLAPLMNFTIDIPSLGGSATPLVNLFLQRLRNDEQERNRQVFALLMLGTFVPMEQGFGSRQVRSGVSSTLAEFLSAQLAGWVGQTLGNEVGVSFSVGQRNELLAQLRLNLGQRLTIERDGILVGPGSNNPTLGNLSARYRLLPRRFSEPTDWQLEVEGFSRQTFLWGAVGATSQGAGIRLRKGFFLPERRRRRSLVSAGE
ncbi:MAG: translocation/assembly module TamB domain-containing protein [Bacteroidia bacterium]